MTFLDRVNAYLVAHFDKVLHFCVGALLASGVFIVCLLKFAVNYSLFASMSCVMIIMIAKEMWDMSHPPHAADVFDAVAGILGGAVVWLPLFFGHAR